MTDIELIIPKGITLSEFIDSIEQSIHTVDDYIADLVSYFDITVAVGNDLDMIGEILGLKRIASNTGEEYRNRLLTHISVINEKPTGQSIIDAADRILGFQPSILEYPAFDFTPLTGKTHPGILINFTVGQLNTFAEEIEEFGNDVRRIKAAGVATFVGHLKSLVENYLGTLDDSQLLFGAGFTDKTNAIYTGKFDSTVFDYGKFEDETHFIDEFITPLATKLLTEVYNEPITDVLSLIGTLGLTENYLESLVDTHSYSGILALNENYLGSLVDTILFTGTIELSEDYLSSLVDTMLLDGTLLLTEDYSGSLVDTISRVGVLFSENYLASLVDTILFVGTFNLTEQILGTNTPGASVFVNAGIFDQDAEEGSRLGTAQLGTARLAFFGSTTSVGFDNVGFGNTKTLRLSEVYT